MSLRRFYEDRGSQERDGGARNCFINVPYREKVFKYSICCKPCSRRRHMYLKNSICIYSQSEYLFMPRVASSRLYHPDPASNISTKQNKIRVLETAKVI